jgi:hypothetical protein
MKGKGNVHKIRQEKVGCALDIGQKSEANKIVCIQLLLIQNIRTVPKVYAWTGTSK